MVQERSPIHRLADILIFFLLSLLTLSCALPFLNILAQSVSRGDAVHMGQVTFWPIGFHLSNYLILMRDELFLNAFRITVMRMVVGVGLSLIVTVLTAYPLSREHIHMPGRTPFKIALMIGLLFEIGLIPTFLAYNSLGLLNNFWVLVLPPALQIFHIIVVMNFFRGLPRELEEAAMIDGASHLDILVRVFLPISTPALAAVTLFAFIFHWNAWFDGLVFMRLNTQWPLQSFLYSRVGTRELHWHASQQGYQPDSMAAASIVFASLPVLILYPYLQRYFVTGLRLGAVKQ